jgi:hypothetical protein
VRFPSRAQAGDPATDSTLRGATRPLVTALFCSDESSAYYSGFLKQATLYVSTRSTIRS